MVLKFELHPGSAVNYLLDGLTIPGARSNQQEQVVRQFLSNSSNGAMRVGTFCLECGLVYNVNG